MKMFILMSIYLLTVAMLLYILFGKVKGKTFIPAKALWIFNLIEKMFEQNNSLQRR